jgi:hypothetical protein
MKTFSFTTDALSTDEQIIAHTPCTKIVVYEDNQAGTADYKIRAPLSTDSQITCPAGSKRVFTPDAFRPCFYPSEVVGYIAAASGSLNMVQEEHGKDGA